MVRGPEGRETPTRFSTAFGKWGNSTARLDGAITIGSEEGRWAVVEKVFPEQSGVRDSVVPLLDHLLIELRRGGSGLMQGWSSSQCQSGSKAARWARRRLLHTRPLRHDRALQSNSGRTPLLRRRAARRALRLSRARCGRWGSRLQGRCKRRKAEGGGCCGQGWQRRHRAGKLSELDQAAV